VWPLITDERSRKAVEVAERFADGVASARELHRACRLARDAYWTSETRGDEFQKLPPIRRSTESVRDTLTSTAHRYAASAAFDVAAYGDDNPLPGNLERAVVTAFLAQEAIDKLDEPTRGEWKERRRRENLVFLRDLFIDPFRAVSPPPFSQDWQTDTAMSLARTMYEARDFSAMPILADALQDAGCNSDDILNHCRDANQVHVRGCWVVDLVLGKE
jgi:hypothetical protein